MIRGDVKIIEDDRTNILILITRPENMPFFETIIKVLDVETGPDVMVQIYRLEYAESESIASMLNDLIGAASSKDKDAPAKAADAPGESGEAAALRDYVARQAAAKVVTESVVSKVGELSKENVKILSDDRANALIVMASKSDHAALREIIKDMDTMLSQVLIETVILEINLGDNLDTGVSWVQRALLGVGKGPNGARKPVVAWAGSGGGGNASPVDPTTLTSLSAFPAGSGGSALAGLTYYLTMFDINVDMVLQAVATDSRAKLLSSPVILTMDGEEASIKVTSDQYFFAGQKYQGQANGNPIYEDDVQREEVGLTLEVTPRIGEKDFVVMTILQSIDNVSGTQRIGANEWPIVSSRDLKAKVSVRSGGTIVMGGLIQNRELKSSSKIPFLGDIPILGIPFRSDSRESGRTELIVFITPYVLNTPEDIVADARRRQGALHAEGLWKKGWSNSQFVDSHGFSPYDDAEETQADTAENTAGQQRMSTPTSVTERPKALKGTALPMDSEPVKDAGKYSEWDPLAEIDDELREYILSEDKKWQQSLERMDEKIGNPQKAKP